MIFCHYTIYILIPVLLLAIGCLPGPREAFPTVAAQEQVVERVNPPAGNENREDAADSARKTNFFPDLESARRAAMGAFYVPLPAAPRDNPPVRARGIYLTGHSVGLDSRYRDLLDLVEMSELNALVIDVKDDHGLMSYHSAIPIVNEVGANQKIPIGDMEAVLGELHAKGIYPIARIVVFKDPFLAEQRPDWAIQRKGGGIWHDRKKVAWINPYERMVWEYNISIAREAALLGFREIQFDYIRFPENAVLLDREAVYPGRNDLEKDELIRDFILYAARELEPYNVHLAADVFGVIATSWGDSDRIGQTWELIAPHVDYICPMVYPSHYGPGYFGFPVPDARPRETVQRALGDALKRSAPLENPAIIRPWLQAFTATWVRGNIAYGPAEIRSQIEAAYNLGLDEYLLWNPKNRYPPAAFVPTREEADTHFEELVRVREEAGRDVLGRNAVEAVETYLGALQRGDWREAASLQVGAAGRDFRRYPAWREEWTMRPVNYRVETERAEGDGGHAPTRMVRVYLEMKNSRETFKLYGDCWKVKLENALWRVEPSVHFLALLVYDGTGPAIMPYY